MFTQSKYVGEGAEPADRWGSLRGRKGTRGTRMGTSGTSGTWAAGFVGLGVLRERGLWGCGRACGLLWEDRGGWKGAVGRFGAVCGRFGGRCGC